MQTSGAAKYEAANITVTWMWSRACSPQRPGTDPNAGQGGGPGRQGRARARALQGTWPPAATVTDTAPFVVQKALSYPRQPRSSPLPRHLRDSDAAISPWGQPPPLPWHRRVLYLTATFSEDAKETRPPLRGPALPPRSGPPGTAGDRTVLTCSF